MHYEIGSVVLGSVSAVFASFGLRELTLAYKATAMDTWLARGVLGTGGMFAAATFAFMTLQLLG